jgi:aconitase B
MVTADPIEVDMEAVEHWDTAAVDPSNRKVTKKIKRTQAATVAELRTREEG